MRSRESEMTDVEKNCRLCGSQASFRFKLKHATIWQCVKKGCGLQFCEPQMDDQSLAEAYSRLYYPLPKNGSRAVYESAPRSTFEQVFQTLICEWESPQDEHVWTSAVGMELCVSSHVSLAGRPQGSRQILKVGRLLQGTWV